MAKGVDYKEAYRKYHSSPEAIKQRAQRVMARRKMEKKLGAAAIAGKDIHHKVSPRKGGTNSDGNLQVMSVAKNRGKRPY